MIELPAATLGSIANLLDHSDHFKLLKSRNPYSRYKKAEYSRCAFFGAEVCAVLCRLFGMTGPTRTFNSRALVAARRSWPRCRAVRSIADRRGESLDGVTPISRHASSEASRLMAAKRILFVVVLCLGGGCLCAGCQSLERRCGIGDHSNACGMLRSTRVLPGNASPTQSPAAAPGPVRPVAHIQPVRPVLEPEPVDIPAAAPSPELTLPQLEEIALSSNPALAEAQARVDAACGKWVQVGLPPNSVLGYSGQQIGSHGEAEQQGVYISQEIVRGGKLQLNRAIAGQQRAQAEQILATQQQRVLTDVRLGFYDVLVAQRRREMTEQLVTIAQQGVSTAEALFNAREVSLADVMRARIELQSAELIHKNARNQYVAAWASLTAVVGDPGIPPTPLAGDLEGGIHQIDFDETLARLLAESPQMAIAMTEVERARWAIDRAQAEPVPNIDVQAVIQSDNGTGSSNANLQVSMPIPWLNRNQGGIRQAHGELVAAEHAIRRLELSLARRLADVYQRYASARNQVQDYSKPEGILANSRATLDFVQEGYQAGEIGYLDLLTVQRTYSQTNLAYIEALGELWAAALEIEGLLLKDSLESAGDPAQ